MVLTFKSVDEMLKSDYQKLRKKLFKQYFSVVLFIMLYKVVLTFRSVDKILKLDHPNENY